MIGIWALEVTLSHFSFQCQEVHEELTEVWKALNTTRSCLSSLLLTTLDGGAAMGYVDVPHVECVVAVHLCRQNAATWINQSTSPVQSLQTDLSSSR